VQFDEFIHQEAEKNARARRDEAETAYRAFAGADPSIGYSTEDKGELAALDLALAEECDTFQLAVNARLVAIKAACKPKGDWSAIGPPLVDPAPKLEALRGRARSRGTDARGDC